MRTTQQLAQLATGDPEFAGLSPRELTGVQFFNAYDARLPIARFRGIPTEWLFVVLDSAKPLEATHRAAVVTEARELIKATDRLQTPVLVISDRDGFGLANEFGGDESSVFCLDPGNIPERGAPPKGARHSPLGTAITHRIESKPNIVLQLCPYLRAQPVRGWQFIGRTDELRQLVNGRESFLIVGPRRIGKTSLMLEAHRQLRERGEAAYYADVQALTEPNEVIEEIARQLSAKDLAAALRRKKAIDEPLLDAILRNLMGKHSRITLFLDELGNVIQRTKPNDWKFLGLFRKHAHSGKVRLVISAFQEVFLQQQNDFRGPLVNFAPTMRIGVFSEAEVEQFIISPWEFWRPLSEAAKGDLLQEVLRQVGPHPLFLQYFGWSLFDQLRSATKKKEYNIITAAHVVLQKDLLEFFRSPVEEVFYHAQVSPLLKYLFLRRAHEWWETGKRTAGRAARSELPIIDEAWLDGALFSLGLEATVETTRNILEGLELYGFTAAEHSRRSQQRLVVPIVYQYVARQEADVGTYLERLKLDAVRDAHRWHLSSLGT